jgi:hypothetical protein
VSHSRAILTHMATQSPPTAASTREFEIHLAFEVDWLVYSAAGFRDQVSKVAVVFQTAALMHARNLLEFTQPLKAPGHGWWICQFNGHEPTEMNALRGLAGVHQRERHAPRGETADRTPVADHWRRRPATHRARGLLPRADRDLRARGVEPEREAYS